MELAIITGRPTFKSPIHVGFPIMEDDTRERFQNLLSEAFDRNYLTNNGPLVRRLETQIAELHEVKHCVAVCSGTLAQMLLMKALGLRGQVILPSFTFLATAHASVWQDLEPVFCDISRKSLLIDPDKVEKLITAATSAIIGVHLFGNVCDVKRLRTIARKHDLKLIFDAAQSFNCSKGRTTVGGFGDAEVLSFHATKIFSTFEGGAVLTDDAHLADRIRSSRNFGFEGDANVTTLGINAKMSEASAAMGLASFPAIPERIERGRRTFELYRDRLSSLPGIRFQDFEEQGQSNFHYVVALVDEGDFGVSRDVLFRVLHEENVLVQKYFSPGCHRMPFYRNLSPNTEWDLPVTEDISDRVLCFPSNPPNPAKDVDTISTILMTVHQHADEVVRWAKTNPKM